MEIDLPHNFEYREYQKPQFIALVEGIRRFIKVWHRRAGKDLTDLNFTIMQAMQRPGNYWHLIPEYSQGRKAIWEGRTKEGIAYMDCFPPEIIKRKLDQQMMVELINGSIWRVIGSDNIDSSIGSGPVGVVLSEYSLTNPDAWKMIEPMLLENGGWASFNFTPRGKNHAHKLLELAKKNPKWFTQVLTIEDTSDLDGNRIVTEEMIQELRAMGTDEETIQQEYYVSFAGSMKGSYYSEQMQWLEDKGRITRVPYQASYPVITYWDIGRSDYTTIWFVQKIGYEFRIIGYYQANGQEVPDLAQELRDRKFLYKEHCLPHDAAHCRLGMQGKSVKQQLDDLMPNENFRTLKNTSSVQADIMATRLFLQRCVFDEKECEGGINVLKSYKKKWNDSKKMFDNEPHHDWASHGADAFRYLAVDNLEESNLPRPAFGDNGLPTFNTALKLGTSPGGRI